MTEIDFNGVLPACLTPLMASGDVDHAVLAAYGQWLARVDGVTAIVCNAHAGEGLFLTESERLAVIRTLVEATAGSVPIIAAIGAEGSLVAAKEAKAAQEAGASAILLLPSHVWLRLGYQEGAPEDRYRLVAKECSIPLILFLYPASSAATYDLDTILRIGAMPEVVAVKNGVRNMSRWDAELPVIRRQLPDLKVLTCQDEYLLHSMWESDGALIGYAGVVPELMVQLFRSAAAHDYAAAKATYDRILPLTQALYHGEPQIQSTAALKVALAYRGIIPDSTVRSPLMPLSRPQVAKIQEAMKIAGLYPRVSDRLQRDARSAAGTRALEPHLNGDAEMQSLIDSPLPH